MTPNPKPLPLRNDPGRAGLRIGIVGGLGRAEPMLRDAHHRPAREVLVDLRHVDVLRANAGHAEQTWRQRREIR